MNNQIEKSGQEPVGSGALLAGGYFCVMDPNGILVHPTISLDRETAINEWLQQEQACNIVVNMGRGMRGESPRCSPSWEQFEAEGYKVVPVKLEVMIRA